MWPPQEWSPVCEGVGRHQEVYSSLLCHLWQVGDISMEDLSCYLPPNPPPPKRLGSVGCGRPGQL